MIPSRVRESALAQFLIIHCVAIGAPMAIIIGAGPWTNALQGGLQLLVASAFVMTSVLILAESLISVRRRRGPGLHGGSGPTRDLTIILVAYLPNEQDVIIESANAVLSDLNYPKDRVQLIVAYNTPEDLPVEADLHALATEHEMLEVLRVHGSTSKAENLIAAIEIARGTVTAIIDSDHRLHPESAKRALRWFDEGYDIVQGRCVIRNADESLLARLVSIEFEQIYGLAHAGRSLLMDTAIFGGANGWWRTDALRELGFDKSMLTEDIDISMRAMLSGFKIVHDRSVMSTELAPTGWGAWWKQRTRWAQGWLQVTMRHQRSVLESPVLPWPLKAYWSVLLTWRELFPVIALQIFTLAFSELVTEGRIQVRFDPLDGLSVCLTFASGGIGAWATWRLSTPETRDAHGPWRYALFGVLASPYTMVRNTVALVALAREALGDHRWVVTARTKAAPAAAGAAALLAALVALGGPSAHTASAAGGGQAQADGTRVSYLVPPSAQPATLSPQQPNFSTTEALPGYWHAVKGSVTLRLSGAAQLAKSSRIAVVINGRQVAAGIAYPGQRTVTVPIPRQIVSDHSLSVTVAAQLVSGLNQCPSTLDPTARMQVMPGSRIRLTPELTRNVVLSDAPGVLIDAFGSEPSSVRVRFKGKRTAAALRAAGVAAGSIAAARGYPGVTVRIVRGQRPATITISDRPGPERMTIAQHGGVPALAIAGHGNDLVKAALMLTSPDLSQFNVRSISNQLASPAPRTELPERIALGGASDQQSGTSTSVVTFNIPGRYEVRDGARLRFVGSIEGVGTTRERVSINGRDLSSKITSATAQPIRIDTLLAGRGPSYLLGDLRPGDNQLSVKAETLGGIRGCAANQTINTAISPTGTIDLDPHPRPLKHASLATWPFPLDTTPNWRQSDFVIPDHASDQQLEQVISVLAESQRLDGEPALPNISHTVPARITAPTIILAEPGHVPAAIAKRVAGGVAVATLAVVTSDAGAGVVLAVGASGLRPLTEGYLPDSLDAFTVDVLNGHVKIRTPNTTIATAAEPIPGKVKLPLLVLGFSLVTLFLMALRAAHKAKKREAAAGTTAPAGA